MKLLINWKNWGINDGRSLDSNMMKTQISNEELYDIVFAVSALALEDD